MTVFDLVKIQFRRMAKKHPEMFRNDWPAPDSVKEEFNVPYTGRDGNPLRADIYRPKDPMPGKLPVIVLIHGGGLFVGRPISERAACELLAERGYLVYAPAYRLMDEADFTDEVDDICAAFDFAAETLEDRGGDPDRAFVIAESAGSLLAVYAAAMAGSERLRKATGCTPSKLSLKAACFVSGMFYTTRKDPLGLVYPSAIYGDLRRDREFMSLMDPENSEVTGNLPPSVLTSSRNDPLRSYTLRYHEALIKAGKDSSLIYYGLKNKELGHAFVTMKPYLPQSLEAYDIICRWFDEKA